MEPFFKDMPLSNVTATKTFGNNYKYFVANECHLQALLLTTVRTYVQNSNDSSKGGIVLVFHRYVCAPSWADCQNSALPRIYSRHVECVCTCVHAYVHHHIHKFYIYNASEVACSFSFGH